MNKKQNNAFDVHAKKEGKYTTRLYHIENQKRKIEYINGAVITKNKADIDAYKVFIPTASGSGNDPYVLGSPEFAPKNSVCSQSFLYAAFETEEEAKNFISYLQTKFFRILVSAAKVTQSAAKRVYRFVPLQDFSKKWNDKTLYKKYDLTDEEIEFIESMIKPMSADIGDDA